jgi:hypothetical protein
LSLACMAASYTPGQTEAAVVEPPEPPDTGRVVSPSLTSMRDGSMKSASAAVWARMV